MTKLLRFKDLQALGIVTNRVTLMRWQRDLGFPRPIKLGGKSVAWEAEAVEAWLDRRRAESEAVA